MDRSITLHIFYWNGCLVAEKDSSTGRPYDIHFLSFPVLFSTGNDKKWENLICHITPNDTPYISTFDKQIIIHSDHMFDITLVDVLIRPRWESLN